MQGDADGATSEAHRAVLAVFRIEAAQLVGALTRVVRDVGRAEELAQDALVAALEQWPVSGVPARPGAWLMQVARRRAVDLVRRERMAARKHDALAAEPADHVELEASVEAAPDAVGDDVLRLMLIACHPVLSTEARVALTLRLLGGLGTEEIARAFLAPLATIQQRIVRAKRTLAEAAVAFDAPIALAERLPSVLEVIYLIFNEGYSATRGDDWVRPELCEDAMRLGRMLVALAPDEAEAHGLLALMELQASRLRARTAPDGAPILLLEQDRRRWDWLLVHRGLSALARAEALAERPGSYTLQAAIAACHARARVAADTDWARIAMLYEALLARLPSPVVALNRAVAVGMAAGPAAGLALVDALAGEPALTGYHLLPSVRADLLSRLLRWDEAAAAWTEAARLAPSARERALLEGRAAQATASAQAAERALAGDQPR